MHPPDPEMVSIQTDIEKAKLARRRTEYAALRDALRRGIPATHIPFLVAAASARALPGPGPGHSACADFCRGYMYEDAEGDRDRVYPHLRRGYRGIYPNFGSVPVPVSESMTRRQSEYDAQPVVYRRVHLDDSFLRRAYKRRSWGRGRTEMGAAMSTSMSMSLCGSGGRSASASASTSSGQVYFHHWVPGGKKIPRR
ncbi:hypothetical protein KXX41_003454 [Aspergillus fumigatus]|nr:hypothetical protein KXX41_003454 [Aspergillus fumigatus]